MAVWLNRMDNEGCRPKILFGENQIFFLVGSESNHPLAGPEKVVSDSSIFQNRLIRQTPFQAKAKADIQPKLYEPTSSLPTETLPPKVSPEGAGKTDGCLASYALNFPAEHFSRGGDARPQHSGFFSENPGYGILIRSPHLKKDSAGRIIVLIKKLKIFEFG